LLDRSEQERFGAHLRGEGIDPDGARQVARTREQLVRVARRMQSGGQAASSRPDQSGLPLPRSADIAERRVPDPARHEAHGQRVGRGQPERNAQAKQMRRDKLSGPPEGDEEQLLRWALLAYPDRVVRRRPSDPSAGVMVGGAGIRMSRESVVRQGEFFVAMDARHDARSTAREAVVRMASLVRVEWLDAMFPQSIRRERSLVFDEGRQRVVGLGTVWYRDLLLREDRDAPVDAAQAGGVLADALRPRAKQIVESHERAAEWLARTRFLAQAAPEKDWPRLDEALLGGALAEACRGRKSVDEVRQAPLLDLLRALLPYPLNRLVDEQAPEAIEVPSGSRIRIDYTSAHRPVLAVRLQEIFGWTDTPRIAFGRVPILLHILGPNFRPVQVTDDLKSFWATTYAHVRKDLRVRYPRHSWPDDPLTATPQAKGGRRR
jgi:ATP-dependent helicase HrpB